MRPQANAFRLFVLPLAVLLSSTPSHATWVCHGPEGVTWQQEHPPCVMPASIANRIQTEKDRRVERSAHSSPAPGQPAPQILPTQAEALYQLRLTELERRYPEIDPESSQFKREVDQLLVSRAAQLQAQGKEPLDALNEAARLTLEAPRLSGQDRLINRLFGSTGTAALIFFVIVLVVAAGWALFRAGKKAASAASKASAMSAVDIVLAAGGPRGKVERKKWSLFGAFRKAKRD